MLAQRKRHRSFGLPEGLSTRKPGPDQAILIRQAATAASSTSGWSQRAFDLEWRHVNTADLHQSSRRPQNE